LFLVVERTTMSRFAFKGLTKKLIPYHQVMILDKG
jgi:hypothetical protein